MTPPTTNRSSAEGSQSSTYAQVTNTKKAVKPTLLNLNIVHIKIKRDFEYQDQPLNDELCRKVLDVVKINPSTDTLGCQYLYKKGTITIELWMIKIK